MKVLLVKWKAYAQEFLQRGMQEAGLEVDTIYYDAQKEGIGENNGFLETLSGKLRDTAYDFVISFNYFPVISNACERIGMKYVSWTVDSPLYTLYTRSVHNSCNYIFVFDKLSYKDLKSMGVSKVWYLPLAADAVSFGNVVNNSNEADKYTSQVSFVGNLYTDKSAYGLIGKERDYFAGFMEGLVESQRKIWGYHFVEQILQECWSNQLEEILSAQNGEEYIGSKEKVFANSCILAEVTARERQEYLGYVSEYVPTDIYTGSDTSAMPRLHNKGRVDYVTEMPLVFHNSAINLNITLRTIQQGISLRVWDVLASGGFLLTNYQPELEGLFEIGGELECYTSKEDMLDKIAYYLEHDEERKRITRNGYERMHREHSYVHRIRTILEKING